MPQPKQFKTHEDYLNWYRNYREENRKKLRKYNRTYNKLWRKKNGYHNEMNSKKRYPEKEKARRMVACAIKTGLMKRGKCEKCGKKNAQGHHDDYSKPLEVIWLCPLHHAEHHKNISI